MIVKIGNWFELKLAEKSRPSFDELGGAGTDIFSGVIKEDFNAKLRGSTAIETYDKMRRSDGMVQAALLALELPIRSANWFVEPEDEETSEEHVEFLRDALFERQSITWDEWLQHALLMMTFGFMVFEKVYKLEDNLVWWKKLAPRLPKTVSEWDVDEEGGLKGITQDILKGDRFMTVEIPVEKLLVLTYRREGSNFEGISVLRGAYKHWKYKDMLYKIAAIGLERNAAGQYVGHLPEGYEKKDRDALDDLVKRMRISEEAAITLPPGYSIDSISAELKGQQILDIIQHHDSLIAKSVLAQFLQFGQEGSGGSRALSEDQSDFFLMNLRSVAKYIMDMMNRHAIPQLMAFNFGEVKSLPRLNVSSLGVKDTAKLTEGLSKLIQGKVVLPDDDLEDHMRDVLGLPTAQREEGEDTSDRRRPQPPTPFEGSEGRDRIRMADHPEIKLKRPLTKHEKGVDFAELKDRFVNGENKLKAQMKSIWLDQRDDVLVQIRKAAEEGKLRELEDVVVPLKGKYSATVKSNIHDLAAFGQQSVQKELSLARKSFPAGLSAWGSVKGDSIAQLHAEKMRAAAVLTALRSINAGKAAKAVVFDVKEAIGDLAERELTATAGISVIEAVNMGRAAAVRGEDEVQAAQYSAILDDRTCPLCEFLDGNVLTLDNPDFERFQPPLHTNCRCIWVFIKQEEENVQITWSPPPPDLLAKHGHLVT